jgi:hypothetical protein
MFKHLLWVVVPLLSSCVQPIKINFIDSPLVLRGTWAGEAKSPTTKAVMAVSVRLNATYVDTRTYTVEGSLALERDLPRTLMGRDGGPDVEIVPQMTAPRIRFSGLVFERDTQVATLKCDGSPDSSQRPRRYCTLEFNAGSRSGEVWGVQLEAQP